MIQRSEYISDTEWRRFLAFSENLETPYIVLNLRAIKENYIRLRDSFPYARIYYAVKANPHREVISLLAELGAFFDIASPQELDLVMSLGVAPDRMLYGNTIKKAKDIAYFYEKGVRMFATDSEEDIRNLASFAPASKIFVRIIMEESPTADWPLSRKFGCHSDMAYALIILAQSLGLEPFGISFHVGSQQRDIGQWDDALEKNISLKMINMGGGFPASYIQQTKDLQEYASEIHKYLTDDYGSDIPLIVLEPGRSLVGDSGILGTEVVLVSRKSHSALDRWVYLDAGKFNGLIETLDESIKYPIITHRDAPDCEEEDVILAGPTCDSMDILYQYHKYQLPLDLKIGEKLYVLSTGAYTASYASVFFNGFPPIKTYIMNI
jgi:ornithine decarboxylase